MTPIEAFVGHSFDDDDEIVVGRFLKYLDQLSKLQPNFTWVHAKPAEPQVIDRSITQARVTRNTSRSTSSRKILRRVLQREVTW